MTLMKKPNPLPTPLDYVPPNSVAVRITNKDSWWTLAEHPGAKNAGLSPLDLCFFNFGTRKPLEINWYLREKVGTRKTTADGLNYMFSNADNPGIVYVPAIGTIPDKKDYPPPPKVEEVKSNAWIGVGVKGGGHVAIVGVDTMLGKVWSIDATGRSFGLMAETKRLGPGLGGGGGLAVIYVTGVRQPSDVSGLKQTDWDFNASLGEQWGKLAKAAKLAKIAPIVEPILKLGAKSPEALAKLIKAHPEKWAEAIKQSKTALEASGLDINGKPNVLIIDTPVGGGLELSIYATWTTISLL